MRAIASRQAARCSELLEASPQLARSVLKVGASRQVATSYFFDEVGHYAYAGDTALHLAAAAYAREIAEQLLAQGAEVRARNRRGAEPLHYASDGSPGSKAWDVSAQASMVELLIRAGADPNALDKSGVSALHRAVRTRSIGAVSALLENGADAVLANASGSSPLHLAVQDTGRGGSGSAEAREAQAEVIVVLLAHGAKPSDRDASGKTVLECVKADWIRELFARRA
jgi:ankyrin repeat protein